MGLFGPEVDQETPWQLVFHFIIGTATVAGPILKFGDLTFSPRDTKLRNSPPGGGRELADDGESLSQSVLL
eukprot:s348_g29.t1